jgi:hypothetical protein
MGLNSSTRDGIEEEHLKTENPTSKIQEFTLISSCYPIIEATKKQKLHFQQW